MILNSCRKITAKVGFNDERLSVFHPIARTRVGCLLQPLNKVLKDETRIKKGNLKGKAQRQRKELSLSKGSMVVYVENSKNTILKSSRTNKQAQQGQSQIKLSKKKCIICPNTGNEHTGN